MTLNVRTFLLTVLYAVAAVMGLGQQVTLSMGNGSGVPGAVVNVNLTMTSSGGAQPTGVQWRLTPGASVSSVVFSASGSATSAGKSISCNNNGAAVDCVLFGLNSNVLPDGVIASAAVTINPATAATSAALAMSNIVVSSGSGSVIASTSTDGVVSIVQPVRTFTISGNIAGGAGAAVALSGAASKTTTADSSGNYSFTNISNGSYTVTATKAGFNLSPASQSVSVNGANATANFTATQQTFSISGSISNGAGATVALSGATSKTSTADGSGNYSFTGLVNGSYTVTPAKAGYTLSPASQAVSINNNSATANFTATPQTWSISGTISGGSGATVALTGAGSKSTTADANGNYSFSGLVNGAYTVTPTKAGSTMSPSSQAVSIANANASANFTATNQTTGQVSLSMASGSGAPGAVVNLDLTMTASSGAQPVSLQWKVSPGAGIASIAINASAAATNAGKSLQCVANGAGFDCLLYGMNSTVLPNGVVATATATISPTATVASAVTGLSGVVASSSAGTPIPSTSTDGTITILQATPTYTISGVISGGASAAVTLTGSASKTTIADGSGNYSFAGLTNGNYTVTPAKAGLTFTPASKGVTISGANATANFAAVQQTWGISGVVSGGVATMTLAGPVNLTTTTDGNGNYSFAGLANGNYTLTPSAAGFSFNPTAKAIAINGANQTGINFTGTKQTWTISGTITGGAGAAVSLTGAATQSTTADSAGNYTFAGLANGSYTVTPTLTNFTMTPGSRSVSVNSADVPGASFTATANPKSATPTLDVTAFRDYTSAISAFSVTGVTTNSANELLLAFVSSDNSRNTQTVRSVTGGRLIWRLAGRSNRQGGTAEIWYAFAPQKLSSVTISADIAQKATGQVTVMSFSNVDTTNQGTAAIGGVATSSAVSGAPYAPLTPSRVGSLILGVGSDPKSAVARVPASGQSLIHQLLVPNSGTMWVQKIDSTVATSGAQVVLADSSPTGSSYNFTGIEVRGPLSPSTSAPPPPATMLSSADTADESNSANLAGSAGIAGPGVTLVHPVTYQPAAACSPGGLATLIGADFTTNTAQSIMNASLPTTLAGVQVQVNGQYAGLLMASAQQIHFLCPNLTAGTPLDITVVTEGGQLLRAAMSSMQPAAPDLFTMPDSPQAVAQLADGDHVQIGATRPARRGEIVRFYPASLGAVDEPVAVEEPAPLDHQIHLRNSLKVVLNGVELDPLFAGLAPGAVGLYQVDVQIPALAPIHSEVPLSLKIRLADGTEISSNPAIIPIAAAAPQGRR